MVNVPLIVLGGGGHAKVLIDALLSANEDILGFTDPRDYTGSFLLGVKYLGQDDEVFRFQPEAIHLVNGLGSVRSTMARKQLFDQFSKAGYRFKTVIHPTAYMGRDVLLGEGVQVMAGAIIQPGTQIGRNTIVNTMASVDHDCSIGEHVHLAPGVILSGGVGIGDCSHIGTGAKVIQGIRVGGNSVVGAGAVVVKDVKKESKVIGVPAKEV